MIRLTHRLGILVPLIALAYACEGPARLPASSLSTTGGAAPLPGTGGGGLTGSGGTPTCNPPVVVASGGQGGETALGGEGNMASEPEPGTPVARFGHLKLSGTSLVSEKGEPVQLRGVSSMWLNWEDDGYATDLASLLWMRDHWNLQVIRAAMGVEEDGGYSSCASRNNMMKKVEQIINNAVTAGVYVIVDFHSHKANEHQPEALEFFGTIMKKYGALPNLILEPFNEPLPNLTWAGDLRPYHLSVLDAIRQNDPDEHRNITVLGTPSYDQKPDDAIGSPIVDDAVMYTVHFYSCTHGAPFRDRAKNALSKGLPLFVTEWGATNADGGVKGTGPCYPEADLWLDFLATNHISWTAWKLDNCAYEKSQNGVEDTSCILKAETRIGSGFPDSVLNGHGPYVVQKMLAP